MNRNLILNEFMYFLSRCPIGFSLFFKLVTLFNTETEHRYSIFCLLFNNGDYCLSAKRDVKNTYLMAWPM